MVTYGSRPFITTYLKRKTTFTNLDECQLMNSKALGSVKRIGCWQTPLFKKVIAASLLCDTDESKVMFNLSLLVSLSVWTPAGQGTSLEI